MCASCGEVFGTEAARTEKVAHTPDSRSGIEDAVVFPRNRVQFLEGCDVVMGKVERVALSRGSI
jgi:hypothetical protein